jgi:hypothetical protein
MESSNNSQIPDSSVNRNDFESSICSEEEHLNCDNVKPPVNKNGKIAITSKPSVFKRIGSSNKQSDHLSYSDPKCAMQLSSSDYSPSSEKKVSGTEGNNKFTNQQFYESRKRDRRVFIIRQRIQNKEEHKANSNDRKSFDIYCTPTDFIPNSITDAFEKKNQATDKLKNSYCWNIASTRNGFLL